MRLMRRLQARAVAMALLVLLVGWCVLGLVIPQRSVDPVYYGRWEQRHPDIAAAAEWCGADHVFTSTGFLVTTGVLVVALAAGLLAMGRRLRDPSPSVVVDRSRLAVESLELPAVHGLAWISVVGILKDRGYQPISVGQTDVVLRKFGAGRWGGLVLHAGFLMVVVASFIVFLCGQRGFVQVLERDSYIGTQDQFLAEECGPLARPFRPDLLLTLERCHPSLYSGGALKGLSSEVLVGIQGGEMLAANVGVNAPLVVNGIKIYQSLDQGHTLGFRVGHSGADVPVYLSLGPASGRGMAAMAHERLPTTDLDVAVAFWPVEDERMSAVESGQLHLVVRRNGRTLTEGWLRPGESIDAGGTAITWMDTRRWSGFILTSTPGLTGVFAGFVLVLTGLILIYGYPTREVRISLLTEGGEHQLRLVGYARRERAEFHQEFGSISEAIVTTYGVLNVGAELVDA